MASSLSTTTPPASGRLPPRNRAARPLNASRGTTALMADGVATSRDGRAIAAVACGVSAALSVASLRLTPDVTAGLGDSLAAMIAGSPLMLVAADGSRTGVRTTADCRADERIGRWSL